MRTVFCCDQLNDFDIHGWACIDDEAVKADPGIQQSMVELRAGGTLIGQRRRSIARPDVDAVVGQAGANKGYNMPVLPLVAVCAVIGKGASNGLTMSFAGIDFGLAENPPGMTDLSGYRTLRLATPGWPFIISDVWFATDNELRMRIDAVTPSLGAAPPYTVRFFQPEIFSSARPLPIGESIVNSGGMAFLSPFLRNPFLPLLMTVSTADGEILCMDAIPFPSLCRGGAHHAELLALSAGRGYIQDLQVISDALLREIWSNAETPPGAAISGLNIDLTGATGAERIFSPFVLQWLIMVLGLRVTAVAAKDHVPANPNALDLALHNAGLTGSASAGSRGEGLTLTIPSDGLPALSGLMSRRLMPRYGSSYSAFITTSAVVDTPTWYVAMPPLPAWLSGLQPRGSVTPYPMLYRDGGKIRKAGASNDGSSMAMAIRFVDDMFRSAETRIFPVAPDVAAGLIGAATSAPELSERSVSVIVSVRNGALFFCDLLASLAGQTIAPALEIIVVDNRSAPSERHAIEAAARELFADRHTILDHDSHFNHSAQTNKGAAAAQGKILCVIDSDIVLHDPRTLETLVAAAADPHVATAGCMVLEGQPGKTGGIRFRSAGIFPGGLTFGGRPKVSYSEPDCGAILGLATYPVAANSFALAAMRKDVWHLVNGLAEDRLPVDHNDIDFCIRAIDAGLTNVCTTVVAAYHVGRATRGSEFDAFAAEHLTPVTLARILSGSMVLRRIS